MQSIFCVKIQTKTWIDTKLYILGKTLPYARFVSRNKILAIHNFWNKKAIFAINNNIQMLDLYQP